MAVTTGDDLFLSTPSARRATPLQHPHDPGRNVFLSTPSARRATVDDRVDPLTGEISIHALREEGDRLPRESDLRHRDFYPRPPRGGRPSDGLPEYNEDIFLSTPSARRATKKHNSQLTKMIISIHALREEGDWLPSAPSPLTTYFYPRPPRGGRQPSTPQPASSDGFLSTPSARRATKGRGVNPLGRSISIHALREEGDSKNRDKISIFKQIIQHSARI